MPAPERLSGIRVVADPAAIDAARWHGDGVEVIRFAPDEAFAIDVVGVDIDDAHAIVEVEVGFVALTTDRAAVAPHVEWPLPDEGGFAQGSVAGVPAKVSALAGGRVRLITHAATAAELRDRLR
ncbi:MAG: hypothetical protein WEC14_01625 [Chloroflexota bacterium]